MAAKTAAHDEVRKDGQMIAYKMAASETLYKGGTVLLRAGYAQTNDGTVKTLAAGDKFAGICVETAINGGVDGDENVRVYTDGTFIVSVVDTITQANVGDTVYVNDTSDDAAVTINTDAGADLIVGEIVEFLGDNKARIAIKNAIGNVAVA